jgi:hypothetical protein
MVKASAGGTSVFSLGRFNEASAVSGKAERADPGQRPEAFESSTGNRQARHLADRKAWTGRRGWGILRYL